MSRNHREEESASSEIEALEAEVGSFQKELADCEKRIRDLRAREDPAKGVYLARDIFDASQDKLRIRVEIDQRERKIRRLRLGISNEEAIQALGGPVQ